MLLKTLKDNLNIDLKLNYCILKIHDIFFSQGRHISGYKNICF